MRRYTFLISILFVGCGGSNTGSDSKENDYTNKSFSLEKLITLTKDGGYSTELANTDKTTYADFSVVNLEETVINGVVVTPQYRRLVIKNSRFGSSTMSAPTWETISYIDTATKNLISFQLSITRSGIGPKINCLSTSPYHLPNQIKLGDRDNTPSFACDNNIVLAAGNWRTEKADKGNLNFIVSTQTLGEGASIIDETITYTIDPQGNIIGLKINNLKSFNDS